MTRRPPWSWYRVVLACTELGPWEKHVWSEERGLSNGKGAVMAAGTLALRLGVSRETVERARRELLRYDLLRKQDLGPGRAAAWFPDLPPTSRPGQHRISDDECQRLAEVLSAHIALKRAQAGVRADASSTQKTTPDTAPRDARGASTLTPAPKPKTPQGAGLNNRLVATRGERGERGTESQKLVSGDQDDESLLEMLDEDLPL